MSTREHAGAGYGGAHNLSTRELIGEIITETTGLMRKELDLAKAEIAADLRAELTTAKALGVGAVLALCGLNMVFVTIAFALAEALPGWAAALIVTVAVLAAAGIVAAVGWKKRVRTPLERTRRHLKDDVRFMRQKLA